MSSTRDTRRASKFDGERRDGQNKTRESRPQNHFNCLSRLRKSFLRWLHVGR